MRGLDARGLQSGMLPLLGVALAAFIILLVFQGPASWFTQAIHRLYPAIRILHAQGTWHQGNGEVMLNMGNTDHHIGTLAWNIDTHNTMLHFNGTQLTVAREGLRLGSIVWTDPLILYPVHLGHNVQWIGQIHIAPGTWTTSTSNMTGSLERNRIAMGVKTRAMPPIEWRLNHSAFELTGPGMQGTLSMHPWVLNLTTPFRPGDGIYEGLSVLLGRPASTLTIPLQ